MLVLCAIGCAKDKSTVKGVITTDNLGSLNSPVGGATVSLMVGGAKNRSTTSDKDGNFSFSDVKDGKYTILVEAMLGTTNYNVTSENPGTVKGKRTYNCNIFIN